MILSLLKMAEIRKVCKNCYNSSSHKANPILTPISGTTYDVTTRSRQQICRVCRREWAPIRICRAYPNSRWRQLDDHLSGSKHKQMLVTKAPRPTPADSHNHHHLAQGQGGVVGRGGGRIRRRPTLPFPINRYNMCMHIQFGRRCIYGDYCTLAHSQVSLSPGHTSFYEMGVVLVTGN